jgi:hypothetical protein
MDSSVNKGSGFAPLHWQEKYQPVKNGEGISRPRTGSRTREYRIMVFVSSGPPMTWITRAETKQHALKYAQARWPGCEIELA